MSRKRVAKKEQLTVRGFGKDLERRLREVAAEQGVSLNQAALVLLRRGAGLSEARPSPNVVGASLDHLIGSWSEDEEKEFLNAVSDLEEIDPSLWR